MELANFTNKVVKTYQKTGMLIFWRYVQNIMLTKKQLDILSNFELFEEITFKELKKRSNQKSNNLLQQAIRSFEKEDLITQTKVGNVNLFTLKLNNMTLAYLDLINESKVRQLDIPFTILNKLEEAIKQKTPFFSLLIFGSFAKGTKNKDSDLDLAILVEESLENQIRPIATSFARKEIMPIDIHVISTKDYLKMLLEDYENLAKQIQKNNIVLYGFKQYIELNKRWTK